MSVRAEDPRAARKNARSAVGHLSNGPPRNSARPSLLSSNPSIGGRGSCRRRRGGRNDTLAPAMALSNSGPAGRGLTSSNLGPGTLARTRSVVVSVAGS